MSDDEERVRYDRQIRLWGKTTQQRLMRTRLRLCSVRGALAEVAKNLVLAGVRAVEVHGATAVTATDAASNFLVQNGLRDCGERAGDTLEEVCVRSLQQLNPHVACAAAGECAESDAAVPNGSGGDEDVCVVLVSAQTLQQVSQALARHAKADLLVVTVGPTAATDALLAFFFYKGVPAHETALVADPATLHQRPAAYQAAVLSLHLARGSSDFANTLAAAVELVERLQLHELTREAVQAVVEDACAAPSANAEPDMSVILATQAGACIAQHIVSVVGGGGGATVPPAPSWMLCRAEPAMETIIG